MHLFRVSLLCFFLVLAKSSSFGQCTSVTHLFDQTSIPREHTIDVEHMKLSVSFVPEQGLVKGEVTHYFTPLRDKVDSIYFDGIDIRIQEARLNGQPITFRNDKTGITFFTGKTLTWGSKDSLTIKYEANPKKGLYFIGWNDPNNLSRKQIWTQGQAFDNRYWIPCFDLANDKLITEVIVNFNSEYKVLSNGRKLSEKTNADRTITWRYKMDHPQPTYLLMLGIGKYDILETKSLSGVPMKLYYYPEWKNRVDLTYKYMGKIFDFLEQEIGVPYAWESYAQIPVQDFMYGAMENTTATILGDFFMVDSRSYNDKNYVSVNAHELAHQWFGDLVTARTVTHLWLQESFATHYNMMAEQVCFGQDHFDWERLKACNSTLSVTNKKPLATSNIPVELVYQKGSQVLEMLKYVIGREAFNRGIKRYLTDHKYSNVDSEDLLDAFHDELGLTLNWFWDEWIYREGEPAYNVVYTDLVGADKKRFTEFVVTQTHTINEQIGLFKMPIEFEVHYTDGTSEKVTEWIEKQRHVVRVPNTKNKKIAFVLFDPNNRVLKTVTFDRSFEELKAQVLKATNMLDRYEALLALKNVPVDKKISLFEEVYNSNTFYVIKGEVLSQLLADTSARALQLIKKGLSDTDIKLRKEIVKNTKKIHPSLEGDYKALLKDSSYVLIGSALDLLSQNFPNNTLAYLELTKEVEGTHGRNVRIKWLRIAYAYTKDAFYLTQLVNYTSISYEFLTRTNAMNVLRRLNYCNEVLVDNCINGLLNKNGKLSEVSLEILKHFYAIEDNKKLIKQKIEAFQGENFYKLMLEKVLI